MKMLLCVCLTLSLQIGSSLRIREEVQIDAAEILEQPGNVLGEDEDDEENEFYVLDDNEDEDEDDDDDDDDEDLGLNLLEVEGCKDDNKEKSGEAKKSAITACKKTKRERKEADKCKGDQACKDLKKEGKKKVEDLTFHSTDKTCKKVKSRLKYYRMSGKPLKMKHELKLDTCYITKLIDTPSKVERAADTTLKKKTKSWKMMAHKCSQIPAPNFAGAKSAIISEKITAVALTTKKEVKKQFNKAGCTAFLATASVEANGDEKNNWVKIPGAGAKVVVPCTAATGGDSIVYMYATKPMMDKCLVV